MDSGRTYRGLVKWATVPVIGMFSAFLGEVRAGPFGPQEMGLVRDIIAGPGNPLRPQVPVDVPDELGVAIGAAVLDVDFPALLLQRGPGAENLRGLLADRGPGEKDRDEQDGSEDDQASEDDDARGHFHGASSLRSRSVEAPINVVKPDDGPSEEQNPDAQAPNHVE